MKRWMGLLEWVNNTEVLKDFVEREYKEIRDPKGDLFVQNKSYEARVKFLNTLSAEKDRIQMHKPLLTCDERQIVANLKKCEFLMPYGMLRRALERLSKNYDSYLHLKNRFISNFAVASVVCYLLGIGDRHLENFLVHVPTATIILIDFGYSFGASLDLPLPELVPFRLTKIFRELMDPIGVNGNFKASMVHSIFALRSKWHQLIDFCDVFVNDPVLDWAYMARKKRVIRTVIGVGGNTMSQEVEQDQSFFKKKIEYVQNKLHGRNPRLLLSQALGDSKHKDVPGLRKMVEGNKQLKPLVSATEQVELLIELATDKNILGRAFTPWCPYV